MYIKVHQNNTKYTPTSDVSLLSLVSLLFFADALLSVCCARFGVRQTHQQSPLDISRYTKKACLLLVCTDCSADAAADANAHANAADRNAHHC